MKVKYIGKNKMDYIVKDNYMGLMPNKIYDVLAIEKHGYYRVMDESEEDYLYPPEFFEIVEGSPNEYK